ncbi:hypothetical protein [Xylella fastidiosa]|uniref:Uncharacterized protein n=1 Tax=Xylella fastidiosa subsp. multiplex TaxID=644357 RepID=A0A9Q4MGW6_XYLFS|nr:hypothetical protein [Xylella fastidiosa]MBL0876457.1 hypothetical protein [Serratia nevei]KAJ4851714.1 hypothetical protein XYFPCFBP8418_012610 [Xylella fastidiosa subsp. multiplex]KAJ4853164.1 hypothetical protein XYFPCFBP8418_002575 [Xylella fastidiosa subsp. multiplex]KAJ4854001.1 hypothetical protein XYFPCFBP8418_007310 [Xylella fastidiosa subsp. multiplex]MBE0269895.1 hypothetical protein [Xylella fastidiosa subsp. multiplex]
MNRYRTPKEQHAARCNDYAHPGLAHCILRDTQAMPNALRIANYRVRRAHYEAAKTLSSLLIKH